MSIEAAFVEVLTPLIQPLMEKIEDLQAKVDHLTKRLEEYDPNRPMTKKEVAEMLGYKNERTVDRLEKKGMLSRVSPKNSAVKYRAADVMRLIDGRSMMQ